MAERAVSIRIAVKDLEAARARLLGLGAEGEEALKRIGLGGRKAADGVDQVDRAVLRAGRNMRFAMGNAAAQIQDVVVSLQAGQAPLTVLIQQGSQLASAFGPVGVILGTVGSLAVAAGAAFFALSNNTEDAGEAADRATKSYEQLQGIMEQLRGSAELTGNALAASARNIVAIAESQVTTIEGRIREAHAQANALAQTADPETAFLADVGAQSNVSALQEQLKAARLEATLLRAEAGEFAGEAAALAQSTKDLADATVLSAKERAEVEKQTEKEIADSLKKTGQNYDELADIAQTFVRKANQERFREAEAASRKAEQESARAAEAVQREAEQRAKLSEEISIEADQTRRLSEALLESDEAHKQMEIAIAGENAARSLGIKASEEQRQAVATEASETERLRHVIQETNEARRQSAQLISNIVKENEQFFKDLSSADVRAERSAATEAKRERDRLAEEAAEDLQRPFETAQQNIQNSFTGTFETIYSGGVTSFEDLAGEISNIFIRLAAELTTLLIFRPQLLTGGIGGGAGSSLASQLGFAGAGAAGLGTAGVLNPAAGTATSVPVTGPGGMLVGGGVTSSAGAPAAGGFFTPGVLGAGFAGIGAGTIAGGLVGGSQVGSLLGSTAGAIAGGAIGSAIPIIGTAIGAFTGGALGGLIGGIFSGGGGDSPGSANNTGRLSFSSIAGGIGPLGGVKIGGDSDFVRDLGNLVRQFDQGVSEFLTQRQEDAVASALEALGEFSGRFSEADPSKAFQQIIQQRATTVLRAAGIGPGRALEGATTIEDIASRVQQALQTQQQINELTQAQDEASRFAQALSEVNERFRELRAAADEFGISTKGLAAAQRAEIEALHEARNAERLSVEQEIQAFIGAQTGAGQLGLQIDAIVAHVEHLQAAAEEWGLSTDGLTEAMKEAIKAVREQHKEEKRLAEERKKQLKEQLEEQASALALSVPARFEALSDPLEAFRTQIRFENKNPTQQFEAAKADFERLVRQAEQGNLEAIAQLPAAGELFRSLAGQFGASPLQAQVDKEIVESINRVLGVVGDAQREASRGMVTAINEASRAQIDTLNELIIEARETKREIRRLRQEQRVA